MPEIEKTFWFPKLSFSVARKLKLHPADENEPVDLPTVPKSSFLKILIVSILISLLVSALSFFIFYSLKVYRCETRIYIKNIPSEFLYAVSSAHLIHLQTNNYLVNSQVGSVSTHDLLKSGRMSIFSTEPQSITVVVTAKRAEDADRIGQNVVTQYIKEWNEQRGLHSGQKNNETISHRYDSLQNQKDSAMKNLSSLQEKFPKKGLQQTTEELHRTILGQMGKIQTILNRLDAANREISKTKKSLENPAVELDLVSLEMWKKNDRQYSGDSDVLKRRHNEYLSVLDLEIGSLSVEMERVEKHLEKLLGIISDQLQMKLPGDLADDLMEMNLVAGKYEGEISAFRVRWDSYRNRIREFLISPEESDFDGLQTLLSQLRQDILSRMGTFPNHLAGLLNQVKNGQIPSDGKTGNLSALTARNVAGSNLNGEVEEILQGWNAMIFHLNRLFPDGNVKLLSMGRVCRSLQWRLMFREKQLRSELYQQQTDYKRKQLQETLADLQLAFEKTSDELVNGYHSMLRDQKELIALAGYWPEEMKLQSGRLEVEQKLNELRSKIGIGKGEWGTETLEMVKAGVTPESLAGLTRNSEMVISILSGLIVFLLTWVAGKGVFRL